MAGKKGMHSLSNRRAELGVPEWHVEVTGYGVHVIRDAEGGDPLKHLDPVTRLRNIHLAAAAPTLYEALSLIVRRFRTLNDGAHRDDELLCLAWTAIYESRPMVADEMRLLAEGGQVHLDLEEAA